jgi:hypothetical protein
LTAFVEKGEQGEGKPTRPGVPTVEPDFIFAHSVYTDIVPSNHFTSCAPGESHEMEFPKDAHTKPPRGEECPFGGSSW